MPGPGGGGAGGGFGGGGGGGGHGGGGPHGGMHGPHHRRFFHPFWGGGCFGSLLTVVLLPLILIILAVVLFFSFFGAGISSLAQGGIVTYDEGDFQDYADEEYQSVFGSSTAYEDNLLVAFLTNEDTDYYYCIAWVGDHIATDINYMFGNEQTEFGKAVTSSVASYYAYSLDTSLAQVVTTMQGEIEDLALETSFTCSETHVQVDSQVIVRSAAAEYISVTESTVNTALESFTESTGIPFVIVINDMEAVFGSSLSPVAIAFIVVLVVLAIVLIVVGVVSYRKKKKNGGNGNGGGNGSNGNYNSGSGNGDGYYSGSGEYYSDNDSFYR